MAVCTGRGANGDHCCYIAGEVCQFLNSELDPPRCTVWDSMPSPEWEAAPVGRRYARINPGYTCRDWPQDIPEVMEQAKTAGPFFACCWGRGNNGDVG